MDTVFVRVVS